MKWQAVPKHLTILAPRGHVRLVLPFIVLPGPRGPWDPGSWNPVGSAAHGRHVLRQEERDEAAHDPRRRSVKAGPEAMGRVGARLVSPTVGNNRDWGHGRPPTKGVQSVRFQAEVKVSRCGSTRSAGRASWRRRPAWRKMPVSRPRTPGWSLPAGPNKPGNGAALCPSQP